MWSPTPRCSVLGAGGSLAPEGEATVAVVVVHEHHERLPADLEAGPGVLGRLGDAGEAEAELAHASERGVGCCGGGLLCLRCRRRLLGGRLRSARLWYPRLRYPRLRRLGAVGFFEQGGEGFSMHAGQAYEHVRVAGVVVGEEERLRIGGDEHVAGVHVGVHHQRLAVLAEPGEQLAAHLERRGAVRRALLHALERAPHRPHVVEGHAACGGGPGPRLRHVPVDMPCRAARQPPASAGIRSSVSHPPGASRRPRASWMPGPGPAW